MPSAQPCALVIFGASGDLAKRKLIPAIYELAREKLLSEKSYIVGFSRSPRRVMIGSNVCGGVAR